MADNYISVGKLGKPHGISGAFYFSLSRILKSKKNLPLHFFLENKGTLLPWFVSKIELQGLDTGFIEFEDITTREIAKNHSGKELYLKDTEVEKLFKKDKDDLGFLIGFMLIDETLGEIGPITEIEDSAYQILATVDYNGNEVMIPLADELIVELNKRKKQITLNLPEGLLDL